MSFVKKVPLFPSLCIWCIITAELAYGLRRDRRSPLWELPSSIFEGVNLSPTQIKQTPHENGLNSATQLLTENGQIKQSLGSATSTLSNVYYAEPTNNDEKNKKALISLGSEPLINTGINNENTWLTVAGHNLLLTQKNDSSNKNTDNVVQSNVEPNSVPSIPSELPQQNSQNSQPSISPQSRPEDVLNESQFSEELVTRKPQSTNFDPNTFQVQPIRPENEINYR